MAPITRMPSRPRLMRPLFSVMHSPRLTKMKGVLTRIAPPRIAIGTPSQPRVDPSISGFLLAEKSKPAVKRFAGEDDHEGDALEDKYRRIRQFEPSLQHSAAGRNAAEQDGHRD